MGNNFWSSTDGREPLRSNRWTLTIADESLENVLFGLKECSKPSFDVSVTEHRHISGHTYRLPGTLKWKPISMKFASVTDQVFKSMQVEDGKIAEIYKGHSLSFELQFLFTKMGYNSPNNSAGSFFSGQNIDKNLSLAPSIIINQLDTNGYYQERWNIYNPFISSVNFGNLSYASDEIVDVSVTLQYDWADMYDTDKTLRESR